MIIQHRDNDIALIAQADHAHLAADIAAHWNAFRPKPWDAMLTATRRHDDGWIDWDADPRVDDQGWPIDFISLPPHERIEIYQRGVEMVSEEEPWVRLLVSEHLSGLFLGRFEPGARAMMDSLQGDARQAAQRFIDEQEALQKELVEKLGADSAMHYRLLQVFDRLSLILCMRSIEGIERTVIKHVPLSSRETGELALSVNDECLVVDPFPFDVDEFEVRISAIFVPSQKFDGDDAYRSTVSESVPKELEFKFKR